LSNEALSGNLKITGLSGMYSGQDIPIAPDDYVIIGRDTEMANIVINQNNSKISRKHCSIRFDSGRNIYMVTDYSTNGTFVDAGSRLAANVAVPVQRGSVISIGSRENSFKLG